MFLISLLYKSYCLFPCEKSSLSLYKFCFYVYTAIGHVDSSLPLISYINPRFLILQHLLEFEFQNFESTALKILPVWRFSIMKLPKEAAFQIQTVRCLRSLRFRIYALEAITATVRIKAVTAAAARIHWWRRYFLLPKNCPPLFF